MNEQYCRRIANKLLENKERFNFYVTEENKDLARKIFERMGLKVKGEIPYIDNTLRLRVLEVQR